MIDLERVIKLTSEQYATLASGGTVGEYTGLDNNYIYLVEDDVEYLPLTGGTMSGGITLNNNVSLNTKHTNGTTYGILYANNSNNIIFGNSAFGGIFSYNHIYPISNNTYNLGSSSYQWNNIYGKLLYENGTSLAVKYLGISATAADSSKLNGQAASYYLNYNNLTNKPTIPATNVIPTTTTANKLLVSTTTSGTAKWSDWSSAGFLKTNASGVISVDTNSYVLTSNVSSAGNAAANKVVSRSAAGTIQSEKIAISSGTTTKATMQYNTTEDCIEFIFS